MHYVKPKGIIMDALATLQAKIIDTRSTGSTASIESVLPSGKPVKATITQVSQDPAGSNTHKITLDIKNSSVQITAKFGDKPPEAGSSVNIQRSESGKLQITLASNAKATTAQTTTSQTTSTANTHNAASQQITSQSSNGNTVLKAPVIINASGATLESIERALPSGKSIPAQVIPSSSNTTPSTTTPTLTPGSTSATSTPSQQPQSSFNQTQNALLSKIQAVVNASSQATPTSTATSASQSQVNIPQSSLNNTNPTQASAYSRPLPTSAIQPTPTLTNLVPQAQTSAINQGVNNTAPANTTPAPVNSPAQTNTTVINSTATPVTTSTNTAIQTAPTILATTTQVTVPPSAPSPTNSLTTGQGTAVTSSSPNTVQLTPATIPAPAVATSTIATPNNSVPTATPNIVQQPTVASSAPASSPLTSSPALAPTLTTQPVTATVPPQQPATNTVPATNPTPLQATQSSSLIPNTQPTNSSLGVTSSPTSTISVATPAITPATSAANPASSANASPAASVNAPIANTTTAPNNHALPQNSTPVASSGHTAPAPTNLLLQGIAPTTADIKVSVAGQVISLQAPANLPPLQNLQITRSQGVQANISWQQPSQLSTVAPNNFSLSPKQVLLVDQSLKQALPQQIPIAEGINQLIAQTQQIANNAAGQVPIDKIALSIMKLFGVKPGTNSASDSIKRNVQQGGMFSESKMLSQPGSTQGDMKNFLSKLNHLAEQLPTEQKEMVQSTSERILARITSNQLTHVQQQHAKADISNERSFQIDIPVQHNDQLDNVEMEIKQRKHQNSEGEQVSIWSVKLHFDLEERGEVDAEVALNPTDNTISTTFLCSQFATVQALNRKMDGFREQLSQQGFEIQTLHCTQGSQAAAANNPISKRIIDIRT